MPLERLAHTEAALAERLVELGVDRSGEDVYLQAISVEEVGPVENEEALMARSHEVTRLLHELRGGNEDALDQLVPLVYEDLRRIARRQLLRERAGHTLSTTDLVHEAYGRLVDLDHVEWQDRAHFCAVAAQAMRRILVDYARRRNAQKRGGQHPHLSLDENRIAVDDQAELVLSLDQALTRLSAFDERLGQVVEYRYFGGLTEEEAAEVLGVSARTVRRDWSKAKAWLFRELYPESARSRNEAP